MQLPAVHTEDRTNDSSGSPDYLEPKNDQIKVIDFGGATFSGEYKSRVINTRQYRAPEVILRNPLAKMARALRVHRMEREIGHLVRSVHSV